MELLHRPPPSSHRLRGWPRAAIVIAALAAVAICLAIGLRLAAERRAREEARVRTPVPSAGPGFALALYQALGERMTAGHELTLLPNGAIFDGIESAIRDATSSVHVDIFIWQKGAASDRLLTALEERRPGVACRVLADDLGSPGFDEDIRPRLERAGCEARVFRPVQLELNQLARNHRKLVVVDGKVAFTGGFGVRDQWLGDGVTNEGWRDTNVRFTGPAVLETQQAISQHWHEAGGGLFPPEAFPGFATKAAPPTEGPLAAFVVSTASSSSSRAERLLELLIASAKRRLWIANAYFVPPESLLERMKEESREGVDVRLLLAGKKSDSNISLGSQHIEYDDLVASGIKVFEYQPSMMHAKTMVVDEELSLVGSINFDVLSMNVLDEAALVVQDAALNAEMARAFEQDCAHAKAVTR